MSSLHQHNYFTPKDERIDISSELSLLLSNHDRKSKVNMYAMIDMFQAILLNFPNDLGIRRFAIRKHYIMLVEYLDQNDIKIPNHPSNIVYYNFPSRVDY